MEPLKTLFTYSTPKTKATSERATLVEYFVTNVRNQKGKTYRPSFIASKLSHLSVADLYFMKSQAEEYSKKPNGSVGRYFWGSLKAK